MKNQLTESERAQVAAGRRKWVRRGGQSIRVQYSDPGSFVFDYRFPTLAQAMSNNQAKGNHEQ